MAVLRMIGGPHAGQILELSGERSVLGRHPSCEILLDNVAVSRHHAQILNYYDSYYVEDLRSRNGTYVNGKLVEGRKKLSDRDRIRVCDITLTFHEHTSPEDLRRSRDAIGGTVSEDHALITIDEHSQGSLESSSIISSRDAGRTSSSSIRLDVNPAAKLKAVLEISEALATVLNLDDLLPTMLESLFKLFPAAESGFIVLLNEDDDLNRYTVKATKHRDPDQNDKIHYSTTVLDRAIETGEALLSADALDDTRFRESESISELHLRSIMCVPMLTQNRVPLGIIQLDSKDISTEFSEEDLELLVSVATQATLALENAKLHQELIEQRDMDRDLEFATQIQLGFLPKERPQIEGYHFYDHYEAALGVGGDYFDYIPLPDGRLAISQGDVSGKGVAAALLMARLYSSVRFNLLSHPNAGEALTALNAEVVAEGLGFRFITLTILILNPKTSELIIANAGHLPPLLRRQSNDLEFVGLEDAGVPLGIIKETEYGEFSMKLEEGDSILLYTDGITEAMSPDGELYGRKHLLDSVAKLPHNITETVKGIVESIDEFSDHQSLRDDTCLVGFDHIVEGR